MEKKALLPMVSTLAGMSMLWMLLSWKALAPMLVTTQLAAKVTFFSARQV